MAMPKPSREENLKAIGRIKPDLAAFLRQGEKLPPSLVPKVRLILERTKSDSLAGGIHNWLFIASTSPPQPYVFRAINRLYLEAKRGGDPGGIDPGLWAFLRERRLPPRQINRILAAARDLFIKDPVDATVRDFLAYVVPSLPSSTPTGKIVELAEATARAASKLRSINWPTHVQYWNESQPIPARRPWPYNYLPLPGIFRHVLTRASLYDNPRRRVERRSSTPEFSADNIIALLDHIGWVIDNRPEWFPPKGKEWRPSDYGNPWILDGPPTAGRYRQIRGYHYVRDGGMVRTLPFMLLHSAASASRKLGLRDITPVLDAQKHLVRHGEFPTPGRTKFVMPLLHSVLQTTALSPADVLDGETIFRRKFGRAPTPQDIIRVWREREEEQRAIKERRRLRP